MSLRVVATRCQCGLFSSNRKCDSKNLKSSSLSLSLSSLTATLREREAVITIDSANIKWNMTFYWLLKGLFLCWRLVLQAYFSLVTPKCVCVCVCVCPSPQRSTIMNTILQSAALLNGWYSYNCTGRTGSHWLNPLTTHTHSHTKSNNPQWSATRGFSSLCSLLIRGGRQREVWRGRTNRNPSLSRSLSTQTRPCSVSFLGVN